MKKTILSIALLSGIASFANAAYTGHVFVDKTTMEYLIKARKLWQVFSFRRSERRKDGWRRLFHPTRPRTGTLHLYHHPLPAIKQTISIITVLMATKSRTISGCNPIAEV